MQNEFEITFNAACTVYQTIRIINAEYTKESIIQGLQNGSLQTTLVSSETENKQYIVNINNWINIAEIIVTDVSDDEYTGFDLID